VWSERKPTWIRHLGNPFKFFLIFLMDLVISYESRISFCVLWSTCNCRCEGISEPEGGVMNKADLVAKLSEKENVPLKVAKVVVGLLLDGMKEALERGERVEVRGFGSFVVKNYGGYKGRNLKTGKSVDVPPKRLPFFKVGKELREIVNNFGEKIPVPLGGGSRRG